MVNQKLMTKIKIPIEWDYGYNSDKVKEELIYTLIPKDNIWRCLNCKIKISPFNFRCKSCALKGTKWSKESKLRISGNNNHMWKGDFIINNGALHQWIKRNKRKSELCENCKKYPPYDLANISGKYKRDINDYEWLCRSCHMKSDGRINQLKQYQKENTK